MGEVREGREGWIHYQGKKIGRISRDKFISHRDKHHFYIKLQSFGIAEDVLNYLIQRNVKIWVVFYHGAKGKEYLYRAALSKVRDYGTLVQEEPFEAQYHLPVDEFEDWSITRRKSQGMSIVRFDSNI